MNRFHQFLKIPTFANVVGGELKPAASQGEQRLVLQVDTLQGRLPALGEHTASQSELVQLLQANQFRGFERKASQPETNYCHTLGSHNLATSVPSIREEQLLSSVPLRGLDDKACQFEQVQVTNGYTPRSPRNLSTSISTTSKQVMFSLKEWTKGALDFIQRTSDNRGVGSTRYLMAALQIAIMLARQIKRTSEDEALGLLSLDSTKHICSDSVMIRLKTKNDSPGSDLMQATYQMNGLMNHYLLQ